MEGVSGVSVDCSVKGCGKVGADGKGSVHVDVRLGGAGAFVLSRVGYKGRKQRLDSPVPHLSTHKTPTHNASPGPRHHKSRT